MDEKEVGEGLATSKQEGAALTPEQEGATPILTPEVVSNQASIDSFEDAPNTADPQKKVGDLNFIFFFSFICISFILVKELFINKIKLLNFLSLGCCLFIWSYDCPQGDEPSSGEHLIADSLLRAIEK